MIDARCTKELQAEGGKMELNLDFNIEKGEFITLYGVSGAGKTSTLRILAGLLAPDSGQIIVNGTSWYDSAQQINLPSQKRNIGYVFQDYALFPNMTVRQNLEFALRTGQASNRIKEIINIIELGDLQHRKPTSLSGGQQQRVALARALVSQPELLLLDEPLAALDATIRVKLQDYIHRVHEEYGLMTILVSHDIGEIIKLSDRVFIIEHGTITQKGHPEQLFINRKLSGKFKFTGEVLKIEKEDVVYVVTVLIHSNITKVIVQASEAQALTIGDKVIIASKAFNPILYKIDS